MKNCRDKYLGEVRRMNCGAMAKIIRYDSARDVDVEFEDGYISKNKSYYSFKNGEIANPKHPTVCGVGYLDDAITKDEFGKMLCSYHIWYSMLSRCYNEKNRNYKKYGAKGVTVCDEWKSYANFKKWFNLNYYVMPNGEKVNLDKDIMCENNNEYSPNACMFVPSTINSLFTPRRRDRALPRGVAKKGNKYTARIMKDKKEYCLGTFDSKLEAHTCYMKHYRSHLLEVAERYKEYIPNKLYNRLIYLGNEEMLD